jgi:hypothetical protein
MIVLKPYEEMNTGEVISHWSRLDIKAPGGFSVFKSPNKALWAFVDEKRCVTVVMWDAHTGRVYREESTKEQAFKRLLEDVKTSAEKLTRDNWTTCGACPDKQEIPKDGYPLTCKLRGFGVTPAYGCTRDLAPKKKEAQP